MPQHRYIFKPTGELWPPESINTRLPAQLVNGREDEGCPVAGQVQPVEQITWAPCEPKLIEGKLIDRGDGSSAAGCRVFQTFTGPAPVLTGRS